MYPCWNRGAAEHPILAVGDPVGVGNPHNSFLPSLFSPEKSRCTKEYIQAEVVVEDSCLP